MRSPVVRTDKQMEDGHHERCVLGQGGLSTVRSTRDGRVTETSLEVMLTLNTGRLTEVVKMKEEKGIQAEADTSESLEA